ncbi:DUF7344 domain-containing protein [Haloarchaeobius litoreus]|uniref:DUF7344 domain-containing protein n=1 Tax=Haloarchaeobius litoreus TaxID=755306 RepID=A0ABD6DFX2_9EURY|nr:hypothetical protein [Haloarchaeobius litoreus]
MSLESCYPDKSPAIDDLLDVLCDNLRRETIHYFENCTEERTATVDELVAHIDDRVPAPPREQLRIQLRHVHLPKLSDRGWLDFDADTGRVRYRGNDQAGQLTREVHEIF